MIHDTHILTIVCFFKMSDFNQHKITTVSIFMNIIIMKPIGTMYFLKISFEHGAIAFRTANASFVLLSKKLMSFL